MYGTTSTTPPYRHEYPPSDPTVTPANGGTSGQAIAAGSPGLGAQYSTGREHSIRQRITAHAAPARFTPQESMPS